MALTVLVIAVLLRPFQISAVQALEGYWRNRFWLSPIESLAIERHIRRASIASANMLEIPMRSAASEFHLVATQARHEARVQRRMNDAEAVVEQYPRQVSWVLPTLLGNVLRAAEKSAGERYGLDTVTTYPRLYPYLSPRLHQETATQLNVIDTASSIAIIVGLLAAVSTPLAVRIDGWSIAPVALALVSVVSYRGARIAAGRYGLLLRAAFDLHRFDMLTGMHRRLPVDANDEYTENAALGRVLAGERPIDDPGPRRWRYSHPKP